VSRARPSGCWAGCLTSRSISQGASRDCRAAVAQWHTAIAVPAAPSSPGKARDAGVTAVRGNRLGLADCPYRPGPGPFGHRGPRPMPPAPAVTRRAGSPVSALPAAPSRTTELPVKSVKERHRRGPEMFLEHVRDPVEGLHGRRGLCRLRRPRRRHRSLPAAHALRRTRDPAAVRPACGHIGSSLLGDAQSSVPDPSEARDKPGTAQLPLHQRTRGPPRPPASLRRSPGRYPPRVRVSGRRSHDCARSGTTTLSAVPEVEVVMRR
jgi:hypothetical protein